MSSQAGSTVVFGTPNDLTTAAVSCTLASTTVGDFGYAWISTSNGTGTPPTMSSAPAGWTLLGSATDAGSNSNSFWLYRRVIGASEPTALTWTLSGGANTRAVHWCVTGGDPATPELAVSVDVHAGAGAARTTAAPTTSAAGVVYSGFCDRSGSSWSSPSPADTLVGTTTNSGAASVYVQSSVSPVAAGSPIAARTITGAATSIGGSFILVVKDAPPSGLPADTATATGTAFRAEVWADPYRGWRALGNMYIAHRGGSADYVEHSAAAYLATTVDLHVGATEISTWMSTDGTWWASHDRDTSRMFGAGQSIDIPTSTDAAIVAATAAGTTVGGYPLAKVVDLINLIPATCVVFVENKRSTDVAAFIAMLTAFPNYQNRFVVKATFGAYAASPAAARAAGMRTWGYYYETDIGSLPTTQDAFDLLGMDYTASGAAWSAILAYGKPVIGHVTLTNAAENTAFGLGAAGVMTGKIANGVPYLPAGLAAGTGTAYDAAIVPAGSMSAGHAAGVGTAFDAVLQGGAVLAPGVAVAVGTAYDAVLIAGAPPAGVPGLLNGLPGAPGGILTGNTTPR